ncbi:helix-turn-helix transcriptional regulator [Rouxiella sp. T17]|uniref:helix-turn-helix transcriptional regulator n=1 Tax=Rouxiella sp. T17 TaxID=3085684 RepID=UPI002FC6DD5E
MKPSEKITSSAKETIKMLREHNDAAQNKIKISADALDNNIQVKLEKTNTLRRASKTKKPMSAFERDDARHKIMKLLLMGEMTQGQALKALRVDLLGLKQEKYCSLVSVSRKTLSDIENDRGNYTSDIINKVFKPFGLKVGLVPISRHTLNQILSE